MILSEYYENPLEPIIIIDGARQIGKSFIIRETASNKFNNYVEIDLKTDYEGERAFLNVKTTKAFYYWLVLYMVINLIHLKILLYF